MTDPMEEEAAKDRLLDQFMGRDRPHYSQGRLTDEDKGDLAMAIESDKRTGTVIIDFGKSVTWIGMDKKQAIQLAELITSAANEL